MQAPAAPTTPATAASVAPTEPVAATPIVGLPEPATASTADVKLPTADSIPPQLLQRFVEQLLESLLQAGRHSLAKQKSAEPPKSGHGPVPEQTVQPPVGSNPVPLAACPQKAKPTSAPAPDPQKAKPSATAAIITPTADSTTHGSPAASSTNATPAHQHGKTLYGTDKRPTSPAKVPPQPHVPYKAAPKVTSTTSPPPKDMPVHAADPKVTAQTSQSAPVSKPVVLKAFSKLPGNDPANPKGAPKPPSHPPQYDKLVNELKIAKQEAEYAKHEAKQMKQAAKQATQELDQLRSNWKHMKKTLIFDISGCRQCNRCKMWSWQTRQHRCVSIFCNKPIPEEPAAPEIRLTPSLGKVPAPVTPPDAMPRFVTINNQRFRTVDGSETVFEEVSAEPASDAWERNCMAWRAAQASSAGVDSEIVVDDDEPDLPPPLPPSDADLPPPLPPVAAADADQQQRGIHQPIKSVESVTSTSQHL